MIISIGIFILLIATACNSIKIKPNDKNLINLYKDNVYIVDLSSLNDKKLVLTCEDGPDIIDLNFTLNAIKGFTQRVCKNINLNKKA